MSIITDKYDGRPKGFAFVEMPSVSEGQAAITRLNGKTVKDRTLTVSAARPRSDDRGTAALEVADPVGTAEGGVGVIKGFLLALTC